MAGRGIWLNRACPTRRASGSPRRVYYRPRGELLLTTVGTSNARRLCPLDMNLLQCPNSPGTEELSR